MQRSTDDWPPDNQDNGRGWGEAKLKILEILWPMEWVDGKDIFNAINQTYYDRRIRELRESGWQIETHSSGKMYKLLSHEKKPGNKRLYLPVAQKKILRERDLRCKICGSNNNLQYDHKVPLEKMGSTDIENMQLLCSECNVVKRGICKSCLLQTCEGCAYAYPELYGDRILITLDHETNEKLKTKADTLKATINDVVCLIIREHFD